MNLTSIIIRNNMNNIHIILLVLLLTYEGSIYKIKDEIKYNYIKDVKKVHKI